MKQKKDVLFLCQYFYPEYVSSATLPFDTAKALAEAGFSVSAMCGYPKEYNIASVVSLKETYEGIDIRRLKYFQLERGNFIGRFINYFSFTFSVALRFGYLRNYRSIVVYSNPPVLPFIAALASRVFKTKMIFVSYDVYPEIAYSTNSISRNGIISKSMNFINNTVFRHVNKVVALSSEMKSYLLNHRLFLKEEQVIVVPNWHEDKVINEISNSYQNEIFKDINPRENLIISYFGNMGICQDLDTILAAISEFKNDNNIKFVFAGHGNKMKTLKESVIIENLKNVFIYDFLHGQDFQDALNISDCFLVSLAEGLTGLAVPSKTYSYMMAGKPIIAIIGENSDIAKDLKNNNAGYAVQAGESIKLINAIKELRDNDIKRIDMGKNCRNIFLEKYTKENCTQQYIDIIKNVLDE